MSDFDRWLKHTTLKNSFMIDNLDAHNGDLAIRCVVTDSYLWLRRGELVPGRLFSDEAGNDYEMDDETRTAAEEWFFKEHGGLQEKDGSVDFAELKEIYG